MDCDSAKKLYKISLWLDKVYSSYFQQRHLNFEFGKVLHGGKPEIRNPCSVKREPTETAQIDPPLECFVIHGHVQLFYRVSHPRTIYTYQIQTLHGGCADTFPLSTVLIVCAGLLSPPLPACAFHRRRGHVTLRDALRRHQLLIAGKLIE